MTRLSKLWLPAASLFALINAAGAGFAAARFETFHAGVHVGLVVVGVYLACLAMWRGAAQLALGAPLSEERLERIEEAVDAIAVEVERIGEAQRFSLKLQQESAHTHG